VGGCRSASCSAPSYGDLQPSGLSVTHEEYREAKARCHVLAFVQRDIEREAAQQAFVDEVRSWAGGVLTGDFASSETLQDAVTRALHELELAQQTGPLDEAEMAERARALIPDRYGVQGAALYVASACGPASRTSGQVVLRDMLPTYTFGS
jgi:hypothetical protein